MSVPEPGTKGKRVLNVMECKEVYRGNGAKGEFVIYELKATDQNGVLINAPLSSFTMLPLGPAEYELAAYHKNGEFKNWTVSKVGGRGGSKAETEALASRVQYLEETIKWAVEKINALDGAVAQLARAGTGSAATPPTPPAAPPDDDDIPF